MTLQVPADRNDKRTDHVMPDDFGAAGLNHYDALTPTIFHQTWWLEVATHGRYGLAEIKHNGRLVGRMPYYLEKKFGHTLSLLPQLTHFIGPAIEEGKGSANQRFLHRFTVTRELIWSLPRTAYFYQKLYRGITDILAFQAEGYDSSVQFTHEIAPQSEGQIWTGLRDKTRNMVRKAGQQFTCETISDPGIFIRLYSDNLRARRKTSGIDLVICEKLIDTCLARDCGRIYVARQRNGTIAAAAFCAWDETSTYYLMSTRTLDSGNSAATLLLWNAIKDANSRGLIFDFDGVPSTGAVLFYAGFGATVQPRYIVSTSGKILNLVNTVRLMMIERSKFF
jgi:hypothetical protein